ncbi:MAG: hypothetical protein AUG89_03995 [Acidobacteria bacterium 13_1_20CM_4_56_7]|nr:MAG: hypothetical protein AUG89_03995 [Acidobacteria bacterium 13_1_20CM_4_56_7]
MLPHTSQPEAGFACAEQGCTFQWKWDMGYFYLKAGRVEYPTDIHRLLKPALVREHGYMYIASVDEQKRRTWRCAVKDCPSLLIDENAPD